MTNKKPILLKRNSISGLAPTPEEMVPGELALNTTDGTIYTKKEDGEVIALASASDLPLLTSVPWTSVTGKPALAAQVHTHQPSDIVGTAVVSNDPRLSDNRDPNPHSHDWDGEDILNKPPINNDGERWYFHPSAQSGVVDIASYSDNYYVRVSEGGGDQTIGTKIKGPVTLIDGPTPASLKFADNTTQTTAYTGLVSHTHPTSEINGLDSAIGDIQSDISNLQTGKQNVGDYALSNHSHNYPNNLTKIGYNSALNVPTLSNPDGISSIGITSVGYESCLSNTTGYQNSAFGLRSLATNTTGYFNSCLGSFSLESNTTGYFNSSFGGSALRYNTTGTANIAVGTSALNYNTTGTANIALGHASLLTNTVGSYNIVIGTSADTASASLNRCIVIGTDAVAQRTGDLVIASATHPVVVSTTVGTAGTAANLPSFPLGYLEVRLNGTLVKIPYYRV